MSLRSPAQHENSPDYPYSSEKEASPVAANGPVPYRQRARGKEPGAGSENASRLALCGFYARLTPRTYTQLWFSQRDE